MHGVRKMVIPINNKKVEVELPYWDRYKDILD